MNRGDCVIAASARPTAAAAGDSAHRAAAVRGVFGCVVNVAAVLCVAAVDAVAACAAAAAARGLFAPVGAGAGSVGEVLQGVGHALRELAPLRLWEFLVAVEQPAGGVA